MSIDISFKGKDFRDLADALNRRVPNKITEALNAVLERALQSVEMKARQYVPVRTGHLRSSIQSVIYGDKVGAVVADADYAGFVEYGTRFQREQPYLRPAWYNSLPEIYAMLRLILPEKINEELRG
jgi:HK97 gp10 family phage protein